MTVKDIRFNDNARQQIALGLEALASAVKVTLGPRGRHVLLEQQWGAPIVTKDGVTVAREVELDDHCTNMGAQMVKEVASRTADIAGDGTTTATVLAQSIYVEGAKLVAAGVNPMDLKRGIDVAVTTIAQALEEHSRPVQSRAEIAQVGTISANGEEAIGDLLAEAMERVGQDGVISIEQAASIDTTLEVVAGMQFDRGYLSAYFVTDDTHMQAELADAYVLAHDGKLSKMRDMLPLLEQVARAGKPLLIIAQEVEGEALSTLVVNHLRQVLRVCAVKAPAYGDRRRDMLEDIAVVTGGRLITEDLGLALDTLSLQDLGRAKRVVISRDTTTIIDGAGKAEAIEARSALLRSQLESSAAEYDKDKLQERLAKLAGGVAVIHVGAATETEMNEKRARVDDALHATRAAVEEGVVPGGGVALLRAGAALAALELPGDQQLGVRVMWRAIEEPLRQMARNAGLEGAVIVEKVRLGRGGFGYNLAAERYEDLIQAGVIDPTKVVRVALQNAASVAGMMLTTEALVAERSARVKADAR